MTVVRGRADSLICCARQQDDGKVFFILNQRGEAENATIDLDCMGEAQQWNAETGEVTAIPYSVADNKTQLYQQTQSIVECGTADRKVIVICQFLAQFLQGEMSTHAVYCIKDSKPLGSLSMLVQFQIGSQDILDCCLDIFSHFMWLMWFKTAQNYYFFWRNRQQLFKKYLN
jgi:hypothetical protein